MAPGGDGAADLEEFLKVRKELFNVEPGGERRAPPQAHAPPAESTTARSEAHQQEPGPPISTGCATAEGRCQSGSGKNRPERGAEGEPERVWR